MEVTCIGLEVWDCGMMKDREEELKGDQRQRWRWSRGWVAGLEACGMRELCEKGIRG